MLGNRIQEARKSAKLTQDGLAKALKIGKMTLIDHEKGVSEPRASTLTKISEICNVSIDWLLTGRGSMFSDKTIISNNRVEGQLAGRDIVGAQQTSQPQIDDPQIAALAYGAYTTAKALGKTEELKKYLANAGAAITQ